MIPGADTTMIAILTFCAAGLFSFAVSPLVKVLATKIGAIDVPSDERRMHTTPIPRLGGLAIFFGFFASVLLFVQISRPLAGVLTGSVLMVVLGVIDDITPLKAWIKLIAQIIISYIPVHFGVVIQFFSNPFGSGQIELGIWSVPLTVIWIMAITNSVNLIDGLDGLAVGVSTIASFSLLLIAVIMKMPSVALLMAALTGASIGFLPYNMNPAKMFMGDTGATFLGFILATSSVLGLFKFSTVISFSVPFLILGLPIFDTIIAIFRRLSKGKSPMSADRSHVHHRLVDMGFTQKQAVSILYVISAILGLSAVVLTTSGELKALILLVSVIIASLIGFRIFFGKSE